ncbi:hypothetical protein [Tepidimicrobium xylanilyticum]|uniref:Homeodomain-like domain-containing protein n=1 Tax=Tepidimicrobium xylanilyticum TaxID=1123352 RepID=A0A1H3DUI5_9FIRM|nr:hypothetical protein [Tepidimicrobium xylanilyticum]GMG97829.1 hypothetical protein EN5CB1_26550 [Tepidimicrobium xylanilyticum]SDX70076.1 hypothetical protein SAMN05660923_02774 [Tepidimicrobium xylanilyticum]
MNNRLKFFSNRDKNGIDLHDLYELIELGLDKDEISKELGISKAYIRRIMKDYYKDYQGE